VQLATYMSQLVVLPHERVERSAGVCSRGGGERGAVPQQHAANAPLLAATRPSELRIFYVFISTNHDHHQPINVPSAGAQVFLMDYT
jgi:hypothetical protein